MEAFSGTWRLVRLALRRDRIKLTLWLVAIVAFLALMVPAIETTYGSPEEREVYATSTGSSMVARMFGGIPDGASLGTVLSVELYVFISILIAFMAGLTVVRHTRQNEEMGSAELLQSAQTGRYSSLTAGLLVATGASVVVGIVTGAILSQFEGVSTAGAWMFGAVFACVGISFAAVAGVTAQLSQSARGANSLTGLVIGIAFLLRAIGDGFASNVNGTLQSAWPSWLSILGWGQQGYPLTRTEWWVLIIYAVFIVVAGSLAYLLLSRRDVGAGIFAARKGRVHARKWLCNPIGLAWRLQRNIVLMWAIIVVVFGVIFGSISNEFQELMEGSDVAGQYIAALGGDSGGFIVVMMSAMIALTAIISTAYVIQILLRLRNEEIAGRLEAITATAVSRTRWLFSYFFMALAGIIVLMILTGLATGISVVLTVDTPWSDVGRYTGAALAYVPALAVFVGLIIACFGVLPRATTIVAWTSFLFAFVVSQFAAFLEMPQWLINLSPFTHIPPVPAQTLEFMPFATLSAIAIILALIGMIAFGRRNLSTS